MDVTSPKSLAQAAEAIRSGLQFLDELALIARVDTELSGQTSRPAPRPAQSPGPTSQDLEQMDPPSLRCSGILWELSALSRYFSNDVAQGLASFDWSVFSGEELQSISKMVRLAEVLGSEVHEHFAEEARARQDGRVA